jgi:hypothetical protein
MRSARAAVPCGGIKHYVDLNEDGTARMLDHDETQVRAFVEFGAEGPLCFDVVEGWKKDFAAVLIDVVDDKRILGHIACEWALEVLPLFEKEFPTDSRPREAIALARAAANGEGSLEALGRALYDVDAAATFADDNNRHAAEWAAYAAQDAVRIFTEEDAAAFDDAQSDSMIAEERAAVDRVMDTTMYSVEQSLNEAKREARERTKRWQIRKAFDVLETFEEGKPWPALS